MSYCVKCGVELAAYHKQCPLCETLVINPNNKEEVIANTDYPDYKIVPENEKKLVKKYVVGIILSLQIFVYSIVILGIDWVTGPEISWSLIPILSLILIWFGVAFPFFRKRNTFFRLFTYDTISLIIYLLSINYIISQSFGFAKYTTLGLMLLWVIIAGIFVTERIRKVLPVTFFYVISSVIISVLTLLFRNEDVSIMYVALPIIATFFVLTITSYFLYKSSASGPLGLIMVLLVDITLLCLIIDIALHYYYYSSFGISWSILVMVIAIPSTVTIFAVRKSRELYTYISKKFHR